MVSFSSRSHSLALKLSWKSHQMPPFFFQKEGLGEKMIIWVKKDDVFTQIMMLSPKKVDNLRAREWEGEKKRIRNSVPKIQKVIQPIVTCHVSFARSINISSFALLQQCKIRTNQDTLIHLCAKILKKKLKIYYVWIIGMSRVYLYLIENQDPSKSERVVSFIVQIILLQNTDNNWIAIFFQTTYLHTM